MDMKWIDKIVEIHGVTAALLVDHDGLIIAQAGTVSDMVAPQSALFVKRLIGNIGLDTVSKWEWTQFETNDMVLSIANVEVGILVLVMEPDANLGKVRLEAKKVKEELKRTFSEDFGA